jgi:CBS domain-containing membrane protein
LGKRLPIPQVIWLPLATALTIGVAGLISVLTHRVVLFASLAPTAVLITQQPLLASTKPYNAIVGHMAGLGSGFLAVWALGIAAQPSVFIVHAVSGARVGAALMAIVIAMVAELALNARHPPGASTTLLAALGSFRLDWTDTWEVLVGVVAVTVTGELLRLAHPDPRPPESRPAPPALHSTAQPRLAPPARADS